MSDTVIAGYLPARVMAQPDTVYCTDLFDQSVDMILCDLPYQVTQQKWDVIIPFDPMWAEFRRVIKRHGAIVLTASQPFTSRLVCSNLGMFRYSWVWLKSNLSNFLNAKRQPMEGHEDVLIFAGSQTKFNRQPTPRKDATRAKYPYKSNVNIAAPYGAYNFVPRRAIDLEFGAPNSVLEFTSDRGLHPTQKPVALFEYLIRTYTQPGDLVFDPCCGSGTTAVSARNLDRRFIVGDSGTDDRTSKTWAAITRERLQQTDPYQSTTLPTGAIQHSLFEAVRP